MNITLDGNGYVQISTDWNSSEFSKMLGKNSELLKNLASMDTVINSNALLTILKNHENKQNFNEFLSDFDKVSGKVVL
jgi:hypothetical protein|nr:MAG TPA: hypothetical protein [Caudoviricetes sp.]